MVRGSLPALCIAAACMAGPVRLAAQEIVFNGDFETAGYGPMWSLTGGNAHTEVAVFPTLPGNDSLCLKRRPGKPDDNGTIEQPVHLVAGVAYVFRADIAAQEAG